MLSSHVVDPAGGGNNPKPFVSSTSDLNEPVRVLPLYLYNRMSLMVFAPGSVKVTSSAFVVKMPFSVPVNPPAALDSSRVIESEMSLPWLSSPTQFRLVFELPCITVKETPQPAHVM